MTEKARVIQARSYFARGIDQRDVRRWTLQLECGHTADVPGSRKIDGSNPPRYRDKTSPGIPPPTAVDCASCLSMAALF